MLEGPLLVKLPSPPKFLRDQGTLWLQGLNITGGFPKNHVKQKKQ